MTTLLVCGGTVVTATDVFEADVLVQDETIAAIGRELDVDVDQVIDAAGKYVLPGCVDVHTHIDVMFGGARTRDDFSSGSIAAAFGGTTTMIDFAESDADGSVANGLAEWHQKLVDAPPVIDVGFHIIIKRLDDEIEAQIRELPGQGVSSIKLFMAYKGEVMVDDGVLFRAMQIAAEHDLLVMVHAENGEVIDLLVSQSLAAGRRDPIDHALTRPAATETEAVNRAIALAEIAGCRLYVVHVSAAESAAAIARAQARGADVLGETCTQYLVLDEQDLARPDFEGAKYVTTPPPRHERDREALWDALELGVLSAVSTDHSPLRFDTDKALGGDDFARIPNGIGGIEERLMVVHELGVRNGRISLSRMVDLLATTPARIFGMPQKGTIAVGADADLVVFDPNRTRTLTQAELHSRSDYTVYEGLEVTGAPDTVLVRGRQVIGGDSLLVSPGHGKFVERQRPGDQKAPWRAGHDN